MYFHSVHLIVILQVAVHSVGTYYMFILSLFLTSLTSGNAGVLSVRWQLPGRLGVAGLGDPPHRFAPHCMQAVVT